MKINHEEIKLKTLANLPTAIAGIRITPLSLHEIIQHGYTRYNLYLSALTLHKEHLIHPDYVHQLPDHIGVLEIIASHPDREISHAFFDGLKFFLQTDQVVYDNGLFVNDIRISPAELEQLIQVIKIQNCLLTPEDDDFNPINERAQKIKQKMLDNKRKIQELKKSSGDAAESLTFSDLISIVCAHANGIHIHNVFELNMFQFNNQFNRMKMLDEYEVNIQALLHGADSKQIQLKHWMSKMG
ncbi:hypothetical protein [Paenibacillus sp. J2TS4]|uniref:hypothetical protein n=1 Tax=Paenibacillus sp. J2TS4 TaxID=2807194 RepID=UPI001B187A16|nr:hypothetical protein [Paenibacillus sp. J2TS4]GIP32610.1 hypothetical protein J2TS4_18200 [Paenibacillus sp. J2TS4]